MDQRTDTDNSPVKTGQLPQLLIYLAALLALAIGGYLTHPSLAFILPAVVVLIDYYTWRLRR